MECWRCWGEGVEWWDAADARGEHCTDEAVCSVCAGTGMKRCDLCMRGPATVDGGVDGLGFCQTCHQEIAKEECAA